MRFKARLKRVSFWAVRLIGLLLLVLAATPLWFPWLLGPVGRHYGLHYSRLARVGYSRFAVESVVYTNAHLHFEAGRIEVFGPTVWGWKHFRADTNSTYAR